jgi:hypothetical protein
MYDLGRALDGKARPFLHGCAVDVLLSMLKIALGVSKRHDTANMRPGGFRLTSKAIHEMGSSWGISVRLTNSSVNFSSSKATVNMAPGGVHVPIIK